MTVKTAKVEIFGFGRASGRRDNWKALAVDCQRMMNRLWQIWLWHHFRMGTAEKIQRWMTDLSAWLEGGKKGPKPTLPAKAFDGPMDEKGNPESLYNMLHREFSHVHGRVIDLTLNIWRQNLSSRKSASGSLSAWISILRGTESIPSFTRPLPIPFDKKSSSLAKVDGRYILTVRLERGENGRPAETESCELMLKRRKCGSFRAIIDGILDGSIQASGSKLHFDSMSGKWFAMICYTRPDLPPPPALDPNKTLLVRPGRKNAFRFRTSRGSFSWKRGAMLTPVMIQRRRIEGERIGRQESYQVANQNRKGHGRRRSESAWTKLRQMWNNFTNRINHQVTNHAIEVAIRNGCGRIVYCQPRGTVSGTRGLVTAGSDQFTRTAWDFSTVDTMFAYKCQERGIEYGRKPKPQKTRITAKTATGRVRDLSLAGSAKR
jgi:hypothetical protein